MWRELLEAGVQRIPGSNADRKRIKRLVKDRDYLTACELIKREMGDATFRGFIRAEFLDPGFLPAPIHDSIINLDSRITATPNFDKIYETRINQVQGSSVAVKPYYEDDVADLLRDTRRLVIKIHGTVDRASEMIFTRIEYAKARSRYRSFYALLEALILTHTFVFFGCGLEDPDTRLLLEDHAFRYGVSRPHYFILPRGQVHKFVRPTIEAALNIKILEYDPKNNHELLGPAINELVDQVNEKRAGLARTLQW
jgi:hypothetical protein